MDPRLEQLKVWLNNNDVSFQSLEPASADASFRRYFRIIDNANSFIVMDAPPEKEDCQPFVDVAQRLFDLGLNVPEVLLQDLEQGFLLLGDLGSTVFLSELNNKKVDEMYIAAMNSILLMQKDNTFPLPAYDETLLRQELNLFPDWYFEKQLDIRVTPEHNNILEETFEALIKNALEQPQVFVHRDYHSRNLMVNKKDPQLPGVIDFQDAVIGAVTYDLVSLLKDCYINWPREKIEEWVTYFQSEAEKQNIIKPVSREAFLRWFDLMGLQRHLKVAGIFSRLKHRDGKTGYLKDIPRTMDYVFDVLERYPEFNALKKLLADIL